MYLPTAWSQHGNNLFKSRWILFAFKNLKRIFVKFDFIDFSIRRGVIWLHNNDIFSWLARSYSVLIFIKIIDLWLSSLKEIINIKITVFFVFFLVINHFERCFLDKEILNAISFEFFFAFVFNKELRLFSQIVQAGILTFALRAYNIIWVTNIFE